MKITAWGRDVAVSLCGVAALFTWLLVFSPPAEAASCEGAAAPCVEDPTLNGCVQCHSMQIVGGNRNGTDRFITLSASTNRHILGARQADWGSNVAGMISKGATAADQAKTTAYLTTNYCPTCTGPILSSAALSGITSTSATVQWTTSANSFGDQPATSCVIYGLSIISLSGDTCNSADPNYDPASTTPVTTHSVLLAGLTPLTKYYVVHRSTAGGQTATYTLATSFTTPPGGGGGPPPGAGTVIFLATGDYNSDFKIDLGIGVSTKNHVIAYLSNGSGGFTQGQTLANVGTTPMAATSGGVKGDFNEDGMDDLAVANFGTKNVAVFFGTTPSGFQTTAVSTVTVADPPTGVAIGEFNSDGVLDLAVATVKSDGSEGAVLIFTGVNDGGGHGTGHFTGPVTTIPVVTTTPAQVPTITNITPNPVECPGLPLDITITGTLLLEGLTVSLDDALPLTVKSVFNDTTVVVTVPASATAGPHSIVVTVSGLPPASAPFTINPRVFSISSVTPSPKVYGVDTSGSVSVYGDNFSVGATMTIGSLSGNTVAGSVATAATPFVFVNSGLVKFYWPNTSLPPGSYDVYVANNDSCGGVANLADGFVVTAPQPVVSNADPTPVAYGVTASRSVSIYGGNFVPGATISVGSLSGATVAGSLASATTPFVFVNSGLLRFWWDNTSLAPGTYAITITNSAGAGGLSTILAGGFTVTAAQPSVDSVSPSPVTYNVNPSASITIYGANFVSGATITVGGLTGATVPGTIASAASPFVWVNSGQVKFYWGNTSLPPAAYVVQVTNPVSGGGLSGTLPAGFVVDAAQPSVSSLNPSPVTYGVTASSSVTIYGANFVVGSTITVGSLTGPTVSGTVASAATPFVFVNSGQLKFYWGNVSLAPGSYTVQVTNTAASGGRSGALVGGFVVSAAQPSVTNLSPASVTYGVTGSSSITIYGSNFVLGATITVGSLTGPTVSGTIASAGTPFAWRNSGELKFWWANTSLPSGTYAVTVTNPVASGGLSASLAGGFVVVAPQPTVSNLSPPSVTYGVTGSSSITIYGANFALGSTITVGSLTGPTVSGTIASAGTPFAWRNSGELKFWWPNTALAPGAYTVTVTNPGVAGGLTGSLAGGFVVVAPQPTISNADPTPVTYGVTGSRSITIYGSNFVLGATITVGTLSGATVSGTTATAGTPFVYTNSGTVKFWWGNTSLPVGGYTVTVRDPLAAGGLAASQANGFVVQ